MILHTLTHTKGYNYDIYNYIQLMQGWKMVKVMASRSRCLDSSVAMMAAIFYPRRLLCSLGWTVTSHPSGLPPHSVCVTSKIATCGLYESVFETRT